MEGMGGYRTGGVGGRGVGGERARRIPGLDGLGR